MKYKYVRLLEKDSDTAIESIVNAGIDICVYDSPEEIICTDEVARYLYGCDLADLLSSEYNLERATKLENVNNMTKHVMDITHFCVDHDALCNAKRTLEKNGKWDTVSMTTELLFDNILIPNKESSCDDLTIGNKPDLHGNVIPTAHEDDDMCEKGIFTNPVLNYGSGTLFTEKDHKNLYDDLGLTKSDISSREIMSRPITQPICADEFLNMESGRKAQVVSRPSKAIKEYEKVICRNPQLGHCNPIPLKSIRDIIKPDDKNDVDDWWTDARVFIVFGLDDLYTLPTAILEKIKNHLLLVHSAKPEVLEMSFIYLNDEETYKKYADEDLGTLSKNILSKMISYVSTVISNIEWQHRLKENNTKFEEE